MRVIKNDKTIAEKRRKNYKFKLECVDGGWGWGETGQRGYMITGGSSLKDASQRVRLQTPGGWVISFDSMTTKAPCLNSDTNHIWKRRKNNEYTGSY